VHLADPGAGPALAARLAGEHRARVGLIAVRGPGARALTGGVEHGAVAAGDVVVLAVPPDAAGLAADLFLRLRESEDRGLAALVVEAVPEEGIGRAVMDRLRRAVDASGGTRPL
jgi:L-threonylcarbamoyladenylate synthase